MAEIYKMAHDRNRYFYLSLHYMVGHTERLNDDGVCPSCAVFAAFCAANKWARSALFTKFSRLTRTTPVTEEAKARRAAALAEAEMKTLAYIRSRLERGG